MRPLPEPGIERPSMPDDGGVRDSLQPIYESLGWKDKMRLPENDANTL